ncbi:hypothetical protein [Nocardia lasii]|uniref:ESX-1 secretion-associated protein n=1 Tax=Nocardia lasii TaxID=1616107 RepID=A0ABW1JSW5_9NOCA
MTDFRVAPDALRTEAERVREAAGWWETAHLGILNVSPMPQDALGNWEVAKNIVKTFNTSAESLCIKLKDGTASIDKAADAIGVAARHFENEDAEFYRQYGFIDEKLGY